MPTSSVGVTDQPTGSEVAAQSFTEDTLTKYIQRVAEDRRLANPDKKHMLSIGGATGLPGVAVAGTNIAGLRKLAANPDVYITRIEMVQYNGAAGLAVPVQIKRATTVAGGTLLAWVADTVEIDTGSVVPTLEVRTGAVTGTEATNALLTFLFMAGVPGIGSGHISNQWIAQDRSEWIRLTGDEGIVFDTPLAADIDNRYWINLIWVEV